MTLKPVWLTRLQNQAHAQARAQALRIDALQWRERLILFLLVATVIGVLLDTLMINPLQAERRAQLQAQALQSTALKALRLQLTQALLLSQANSAPGQLLQGIRQQQAEQAKLQQQIASQTAASAQSSTAQVDLPELLTELLRQQAGLALIKLNTVNDAPKFASTATLEGWQWRGVELRVAGDYLALLRYLRQLEQALPSLHWGEMKLSAVPAGQTSGQAAGQATSPAALLQLQVFMLKTK